MHAAFQNATALQTRLAHGIICVCVCMCVCVYLCSCDTTSMDHGYGGRRDPFVIYHERVADSRDTRHGQRYGWPNEQWKLPWIEGNNRVKLHVHAPLRNRDRVLGPAALG